MADPPAYPGPGEDGEQASRPPLPARQRAVRVLLIAAAAALIVVVIVLHAAGVLGPGGHG